MSGHIPKVNREKERVLEEIAGIKTNPLYFVNKETLELTEESRQNITEEQDYIKKCRIKLSEIIGEYNALGRNASQMLPRTKAKYLNIADNLRKKDEYLGRLEEINSRILSDVIK